MAVEATKNSALNPAVRLTPAVGATPATGEEAKAATGAQPDQAGATPRLAGDTGGAQADVAGAIAVPGVAAADAIAGAGDRVPTEAAGPVQPWDLTFGMRGHVKDGQNARLLGLLDRAVAASPELAGSALAAHLKAGEVTPGDIEGVQRFLEGKGYSVGATGVDGKYGPRTHAALAAFLNGEAPTASGGLSLGDRGAGVKAMQERLQAHGYQLGEADGHFGSKTRAALMNFQRQRGLTPSGEADGPTRELLAKSPEEAPPLPPRRPEDLNNVPIPTPRPDHEPTATPGSGPDLVPGQQGPAVVALQQRLSALGYDTGPADGEYGPRTESAVMAFQVANQLPETGKMDAATWKPLGIQVTSQADAPGTVAGTEAKGDVVQTPDGPMVRRQGHMISTKIAEQFDKMVAAAKADGVTLQIESAYRSYAEQVVLWNKYGQNPRRVARPGTSNHQKGTAIDFKDTGNKGYQWLARNAHKFGLYGKVPGEPWHYSLTGR